MTLSQSLPASVSMYYGRLFLETVISEIGESNDAKAYAMSVINPKWEAAIVEAAKKVAR